MSVSYAADPAGLRAVAKGLELLAVLNQRNGLSATELGAMVDLPRSTVFRLIKTLADDGYVRQDPGRRYRLTRKVRELCSNLTVAPWVTTVAAPGIQSLQIAFGWPLALASLHGERVLLDYVTDRQCPQVIARRMVGYELTLVDMAASRVILAGAPPAVRKRLVRRAQTAEGASLAALFGTLRGFTAELTRVADAGFAEVVSGEVRVIAVPLNALSGTAALSMRVPLKADDQRRLSTMRVVRALRRCARTIEQERPRRG